MIRLMNLYGFYLRLVCYLLPPISFLISGFLLASEGHVTGYNPHDYFLFLLVMTIVWCIAAERYQVTSIEKLFIENTGAHSVGPACTTTYAVMLAAVFFYKDVALSRLFFIVSAFILLVMALLMRAVFRLVVRQNRRFRRPIRVLIIGADRFAYQIARRLERVSFSHCCVVGFSPVDGQEIFRGIDLVYQFDEIASMVASHAVDDIVLALKPTEFSLIPNLLGKLEKFCLPIRAVLDLGEGIVVRDRLFQFGRLQMLNLAASPAESLDYTLLKRLFDILFSVFVIVVTAPLMMLIALAIRLTSPGPVIFAQERVGLNTKIFQMYKFRTMHVAPESESDKIWTKKNDPRCTRVGALLRRTSLDELPQFFNVLKGDMSVVGPRPERPHFVQKFLSEISRYNNRHRLKVGITGWAQVNGLRGDTPINRRVEYDLYYLQNWSFSLDLRIIALTLFSGLGSRNAY